MKRSHTTPQAFLFLGLVVSCLIGLPQLYDKFMIARFIAVAAVLALVFLVSHIGKQRWLVPQSPVVLPYMAFLLLCGISLFWATNTAEAIFAYAALLLTPLIIIVVYTLLAKSWHATQTALWIAAAVILLAYLSFAIMQLTHVEDLSFGQLYRVGGLNGHKNLLAVMLFLLSAYLLTAFGLFKSKALKWVAVGLFAVSLIIIILLKSRAVLLSVIVAAVFFGVLFLCRKLWCIRHCEETRCSYSRTKPVWVFVFSIILVYVFLTIGLRWFADRSVPHTIDKSQVETKMTSTSSLVERCLLWDKTYCIADKRPWTGYGIGNWQIHFPDAGLKGLYRADLWNINFTKPHNEYLGVLAETGYIGLLLYVAFLVALIVNSFFVLRTMKDKHFFLCGAIVLSTFVGSCVNALFDFPNSRIEHIVWTSVLMAMLLIIIGQQRLLGKGWNIGLLSLSLLLVALGVFRLMGEKKTFEMQQALKQNDWNTMERYCSEAVSPFYTIDPIGLPLHWYQGKAQKQQGKSEALESFRLAQHYAPYCKENLNDLGLAEFHDGDPLSGLTHLKEAIRISPGYLYPQLNLAYLYLSIGMTQKAQEVSDAIDYDAKKREVLKADAAFFEPQNAEALRRKIDADYEAVQLLRKKISEKVATNRN